MSDSDIDGVRFDGELESTRPFNSRARSTAVIHGYTVIRKLGSGSAGDVYEAWQAEPVRRIVALKLIRTGLDPEAVLSRFESEREALSRMNNPNIAQVFNAGLTHDGRPFLAMEFVSEAVSITDYCDKHEMTVRERLELYLQVCDGVQHAHVKGVIHRDIKGSNILVSDNGEKAVPKLIDFGVAKAIEDSQFEQPLKTAHGILVGTPAYMSPEQADPAVARDIDTRTDVYSLGVLLFRLLTGRFPFEEEENGTRRLDLYLQRIRHEDIPRPSAHLQSLGKEANELARRRGTNAVALRRELQRDLDWVVLKATERNRSRRYQTATALSADVRRLLRNVPITARPPSRPYRIKQFIRRHRAGTAFAVTLVVMLALFAASMTYQTGRLAAERDRTRQQAEVARQVSEYVTGLFDLADPNAANPDAVTVRQMVDRAAKDVLDQMQDQPEVQAGMLDAVGRIYESLGLYEDARPLLERSLELRLASGEPAGLELARAQNNLANLLWRTGEYERARDLYSQSLELKTELFGPDHPDVATALNNLAVALKATGDLAGARVHYERALQIWESQLGPEHPDVAMALNNIAVSLKAMGQLDEALVYLNRSLAIKEAALGLDHPAVARTLHNRGNLLRALERLDEAEESLRRSLAIKRVKLGADHPSVAWTLNGLAFVSLKRGAPDEAVALHEEANDILFRALGAEHPNVLYDEACYAALIGQGAEAVDLLEQAVEAGFSSTGMARDTDLVLVHDDPRFLRLMAELTGNRALAAGDS